MKRAEKINHETSTKAHFFVFLGVSSWLIFFCIYQMAFSFLSCLRWFKSDSLHLALDYGPQSALVRVVIGLKRS